MACLPRRSFLALLAAGTTAGAAAALGACTASPAPPGQRSARTVAEGLDTPWSIAFLPGGSALVSERGTGRILEIPPDGGGPPREAARIAVRTDTSEGGLLGLAASPRFAEDGVIYAYYTALDSGGANRVVALQWDGRALGGERVLVDGIPAGTFHNGGRIKVGPDGLLYVGTGDATRQANAQDLGSLGGKVLRVTPGGAPAPGNPFGTRVYTYGHRNVQGLAWDSGGRLWASELGPDRDDELNLLTAGSQYGWPDVTGARSAHGSIPAVHVWPSTADASPSALAIIDDVAYVACLRGERLWRVPLPAPGVPVPGGGTLPGAAEYFRGQYGRLRDVAVVPDEARGADGARLWIATNEGTESRILAVTPP